jgi:hypothetical protein
MDDGGKNHNQRQRFEKLFHRLQMPPKGDKISRRADATAQKQQHRPYSRF